MSSVVTLPTDQLAVSANHARDYWHAFVPPHTTIEDVRKSTFWANHISKLRPGALVDLMTRDGHFDISVRIVNVSNGIVKLNVIRHYEDDEARAPIIEAYIKAHSDGAKASGFERAREVQQYVPEGYKVGWNPGSSTFYVQYKATGQHIAQNILDEMQGVRAARAHARAAGIDVPWDEVVDGQPPKEAKAKAKAAA